MKTLMNAGAIMLLLVMACGKGVLKLPKLPKDSPSTLSELSDQLSTYLDDVDKQEYDGIVGLHFEGHPDLIKPLGFANKESQQKVSVVSIFPIGSLTKAFVGAGVAKLAQDGKLKLDDRINQYFDNVPDDKAAITIEQLLTHTSGFTDILGPDAELIERDALVQKAFESKLKHDPGKKFLYSNVGYSVAATIIEKVSGLPHEQYIQEQILTPAGISSISYDVEEGGQDKLAVGYEGDKRWGTLQEQPRLPDGPGWNWRGNGGFVSTVSDMFSWSDALQNDQIFSEETRSKIFGQHVLQEDGDLYYGYGWDIGTTSRGTTVINHDGGNGIFYARITWWIDEGIFLFTASNNAKTALRRPSLKPQWTYY